MSSPGSVTRWFDPLLHGDPAAAQALWERFFPRLVELAQQKLGAKPRVADGEDVALSALDSFFRGVQRGRFPDLQDRDNLWPLLVTLTLRKAGRVKRENGRLKRGGGLAMAATHELERLCSPEPSPGLAAEFAESCQRMLDLLKDDSLRIIALRKLEGFTNDEVADELACAPRTIERKLGLIRGKWEKASRS
jgi:DNA-directed RNA polymerase specialized sigma24 family protein